MQSNLITKTAKITFIVVLVLLLTLFFLYVFKVLLLILGGTLIALFFDGIASFINEKLPKTNKRIITVFTVGFIIGIFTLLIYNLYPRITEQIIILKNDLPEAINSLRKTIQSNEALNYIVENINNSFKSKGVSGNIQSFFSSVFGIIGDFYIMIALGFFFLVQPSIYIDGIIQLFTKNSRKEVLKTIISIEKILKKWLLGKLFSMLIVGFLTGIGLYLLGVPLALTLAIIATICAFIPNVGPIIALAPALLIAFSKGDEYVLYTFLLYTGIQVIESNIITPLIQREVISFPMALILIAQVVLGLFTGYLGLILATPVVAILLLLVKKIYIQNYLEKA